MRSEDDAIDAVRHAHRAASDALDDAPDARVRAAVLAAATRGIGDARPSRARRWPLSAAALLVVSIVTGVVASRVLRGDPERATTIASVAPTQPTPGTAASPPAEPPAPSLEAPAPAATASVAPPRALQRRQATRNEVHPPDLRASADRATPIVAAPTRETMPPAAAPQTQSLAKTEGSADAVSCEANTPAPDADAPSALRAPTAMRSRIGRAAEPASAEAWVERIVRLRADGNDSEADRELDVLRQRFPGFPVPASALRASGTR